MISVLVSIILYIKCLYTLIFNLYLYFITVAGHLIVITDA